MAAWSLTSFDANAFSTNVTAFLSDQEPQEIGAVLLETPRRDTYGTIDGTNQSGLSFNVHLYRPSGSGYTVAQFHENVRKWFLPSKNKDGERLLVLTNYDGTTAVRLGCYVTARWIVRAKIPYYVMTLYAPYPYFEADTLTTSASNPATVTNAGNADARPSVAMTQTTHGTWKHYTFTGDGAGSGFWQFPYRFSQADTACTTATCMAYHNGKRVPVYVDDSGLSTSAVYVLCSNGVGTTSTVDIVYGGGLVAGTDYTLDDGGMNWASNSFTNNLWRWDDWAISSHPVRPGVWRPIWLDIALNDVVTGDNGVTRTACIGIQSEAAGSVVFEIVNNTTTYPNTANGVVMDVGGAQADTSSGLDLYNGSTNNDGTNSRLAVYYQLAGSDVWTLAGSNLNPGALGLDDYQVDNAVRVAVLVEQTTTTIDPSTWTISGATDTTFGVHSSFDPTVTLVSTTTLDVYNGTLGFTDATMTFTDYAVPDGTTTVNAKARTITPASSGAPKVGSYTFSDSSEWLTIPGTAAAVAVTRPTASTITVTHRDCWT